MVYTKKFSASRVKGFVHSNAFSVDIIIFTMWHVSLSIFVTSADPVNSSQWTTTLLIDFTTAFKRVKLSVRKILFHMKKFSYDRTYMYTELHVHSQQWHYKLWRPSNLGTTYTMLCVIIQSLLVNFPQ